MIFITLIPAHLAFLEDVGGGEVLVILAAVLILFGGKGLPTIARKLGKTSRELQKAAQEFKNQLLEADQETSGLPNPPPPPKEKPPRELTG
ncbi:MAG: twin-arginine translocase TatA/TatE family subunit [bacterium]